MTWVRLDGQFPSHPKIQRVGPIGAYVYMRGLCYVALHGTDGLIPVEALPELLVGLRGLKVQDGPRSKTGHKAWLDASLVDWPSKLCMAGLWEPEPGVYRVHNYLARNPDAQYFKDLSDKRRAAGHLGGLRSSQSRANRSIEAKDQALAADMLGKHRSKTQARNDTIRNEEAVDSVSEPIHSPNPAEPSPEPASNGHGLSPEQVKADVERLQRLLTRPAP